MPSGSQLVADRANIIVPTLAEAADIGVGVGELF